jgi:hypothetical protein
MENRLIFVTYKGGNCGDFFCSLLDRAFGNDDESFQDETNRCVFKNPAFMDHRIKGLEEVFRRYNKHEYIIAVDQMKNRSWLNYLEWTKQVHDFCYDPDRNEFIRNVIEYIASNLKVYKKNTVASIHYYDYFEGFNLSDIYQPSVTLQLMTEDPLYHNYFFFLARYKQRFHLIRNAPDWYTFIDEPTMVKQLPGAVTRVDSGRLFFENGYEDELDATLSKTLDMEVKVDRDYLNSYREGNDRVLKNFFGDDYRSMSVEEFKTERKRLFAKIREELVVAV